jgi:N-acetylglucosaminyl-diphospho-decaprenol L-rhamnosyltransferase
MDLSILIVNWNTRTLLLDCLAALYAAPPRGAYEVVVVDNASTDGSADAVAQAYPQVRLLRSEHNLGFARANNQAAHLAQGRFLLLLNPDTRVAPRSLDRLVEHLQGQARAAAAGPRLLNADGTWQVSVERAPTLLREFWRLFHLDRLLPVSRYPRRRLEGAGPHTVDVIKGACLLLRRSALPAEGVFDEDYFIYSEETDLCERLRHAGWELHWVPDAVVTHLGGQSTGQAPDELFLELYRNKVRFFRKRRGAGAAAAYKVILLLAGGARYLLGQGVRPLRLKRSPEWARLTRLYGRLLGALPTL